MRCHTCDIDLSSYDPFISHEQGKSHKKVRQQKQLPKGSGSSVLPKQRKINSPWDFLEIGDGTLEKKLNGLYPMNKERVTKKFASRSSFQREVVLLYYLNREK